MTSSTGVRCVSFLLLWGRSTERLLCAYSPAITAPYRIEGLCLLFTLNMVEKAHLDTRTVGQTVCDSFRDSRARGPLSEGQS